MYAQGSERGQYEDRVEGGGGGDDESQWAKLPLDILSKIICMACGVPSSPHLDEHDKTRLASHFRNFQGNFRLVNKQWCMTVDHSLHMLMPDWAKVDMHEVLNVVHKKFPFVERLVFLQSWTRNLDRFKVGSFCDLRGGTQIKELDLSGLPLLLKKTLCKTEWRVLMNLTNLEGLNLSGCEGLVCDWALRYASRLASLKRLDVSWCDNNFEGRDLPYLAPLTKLTQLNMAMCGNVLGCYLQKLSRFTALRHLDLYGCPRLLAKDLRVVSNLTLLTHLDIRQERGPDSSLLMKHITNLVNLKTLGCTFNCTILYQHNPPISDIDYLEKLRLTSLWAEWRVPDYRRMVNAGRCKVDVLSKMESLRDLTVHAPSMSKSFLQGLEHLSTVTSLELKEYERFSTSYPLETLGHMVNLRRLSLKSVKPDMRGCLEPLTHLVHLSSLSFPFGEISQGQVEDMTNLTQLVHLGISIRGSSFGNGLQEVAKMTNLRSLTLYGVESNLEIDGVLKALTELIDANLRFLIVSPFNKFDMNGGHKYSKYTLKVLQEHPNLHIVL